MLAANLKKLTFSALVMGFLLICFYLQGILTTTKLSLLALMSLLMGLQVLVCGERYALLTWVGTGILALLLAPFKISAILFIVYFGIYPILKIALEKRCSTIKVWTGKGIYLILLMGILFLLQKSILSISIALSLPLILLVAGIFFILFDFLLTFYFKWLFRQKFLQSFWNWKS